MAGVTKGGLDKFANIAAISVTESASNTQTSAKFAFPFSIMDKVGLIISRIEYWLSSPSLMDTTTDSIFMGLITASSVSDLAVMSDPLIVDTTKYQRQDYGTAASGMIFQAPYVKDFSSLPGGGLLVAPNPLYAAIKGSGCSAATSFWLKLFYTYMELQPDEYWQLVESRRIITS